MKDENGKLKFGEYKEALDWIEFYISAFILPLSSLFITPTF
jgi:hypothetical protein